MVRAEKPACRVAVYGGTFDPVHYGHIAVARAAIDCGEADEVWMNVSPRNPLKQDCSISPDSLRLEMLRAALAEEHHIFASDFEMRLPVPSYSIDTLRALEAEYPDKKFRLLIGADNLTGFSRWRSPAEIISGYGLIVYPRPGFDTSLALDAIVRDFGEDCSGNIRILKGVREYPVSATRIRELTAARESIDGLTPPGVIEIIRREGLYAE